MKNINVAKDNLKGYLTTNAKRCVFVYLTEVKKGIKYNIYQGENAVLKSKLIFAFTDPKKAQEFVATGSENYNIFPQHALQLAEKTECYIVRSEYE